MAEPECLPGGVQACRAREARAHLRSSRGPGRTSSHEGHRGGFQYAPILKPKARRPGARVGCGALDPHSTGGNSGTARHVEKGGRFPGKRNMHLSRDLTLPLPPRGIIGGDETCAPTGPSPGVPGSDSQGTGEQPAARTHPLRKPHPPLRTPCDNEGGWLVKRRGRRSRSAGEPAGRGGGLQCHLHEAPGQARSVHGKDRHSPLRGERGSPGDARGLLEAGGQFLRFTGWDAT